MKKFIPIFLIFFFISTCFNIIGVYAAPKTFKQAFTLGAIQAYQPIHLLL